MIVAGYVVLILCTALLFWQFMGYPIFITLLTQGKKKVFKDYAFHPHISVVVPTYNEEKSIVARIHNLLAQRYPIERFDITVVDSASTDSTASLVEQHFRDNHRVRLIREDRRRGKASAINTAINAVSGEIVLVTDANTIFDECALREIAPHFKDPKVGAVGGRLMLANIDERLVGSSSFYWDLESLMRQAESSLDSACLFHGEINAWRKDIVKAEITSLSEDLDMAIKIRKQGYRIHYEPAALASEPGPKSSREQIVQKKRTTIGTIQAYFKHLRYFLVPGDLYRVLIFPSHKVLQILSPFLLLGAMAALLVLVLKQDYSGIAIYLVITGLLFVVSLLLLNKIMAQIRKGLDPLNQQFLLSRLFRLASYVLLHEYIVLLAWRDYITGKYAVTWQKVSR
jgi:poly-beta-1,6-N-acetyl-D-glucosamine synthase